MVCGFIFDRITLRFGWNNAGMYKALCAIFNVFSALVKDIFTINFCCLTILP